MKSQNVHNTGSSQGGGGRRRSLWNKLRMKVATGLMVASGVVGIGHAPSPAVAKNVGNGKQKTTKFQRGVERGRSMGRQAAAAAKRVATKATGGGKNFALLNKYKEEVKKYGAAKLEGFKQKMEGVASWYGGYFHGRLTASGRRFNTYAHMAAHRSLPFGTLLRVSNPTNGKSVIVEVLDRGPYVANRMLDLSEATAKELGFQNSGVAQVQAEILKMGDLDYEVEAPLSAAEMRGDVVKHRINLAGLEEPAEKVTSAAATASEDNTFFYNASFRNVLPQMRTHLDALATSIGVELERALATA
jgi:rare lipoprotein A